MRLSRSLLLAVVPLVAAVAAEPDTIATSFGGHPFTVRLPTDTAGTAFGTLRGGARPGFQTYDQRLQGDIALAAAPGDLAAIAAEYRLRIVSQGGGSAVLAPQPGADEAAALRSLAPLALDPRVQWSEPVLIQRRQLRLVPGDARFGEQWQLDDAHLNVESVWDTYTGSGIRIGIVDSGVKVTHPDLAANCVAGWDLLDNDSDPTPSGAAETDHGTATAGTAAAVHNSVGGVGVAFGASIVPLRLIDSSEDATTTMAANALGWGLSGHIPSGSGATEVDISNNSWGPADDAVDDGAAAEGPSSLEQNALAQATTSGRGNKGTIFVWACGNGGDNDTCDRDGYASDRHVISVGSTKYDRSRSYYSERGNSLFVSAPVGDNTGSGVNQGALIPTYSSLAAGVGDTYDKYSGTSFAAPTVAGVVALMLQANPTLTWRDVRHIIAQTAFQDDDSDANWIINGAGLHWNLNYGFGNINAAGAVSLATSWTNLPAAATPLTASAAPNVAIPDNGATAAVTLPISADAKFRAEWVELTVDCQHPYQGDLAFTLTSPRGTTVNFLARPKDNAAARVWTLTSVATWEEWPDGNWTVVAHDVNAGDTGTFKTVGLKVYGYLAISAAAAGTGTASGTSTLLKAGGTKPSSGGSTGGTTTPTTSDGGGGGCGLGAGTLALTGLLGFGLLRWRRRW